MAYECDRRVCGKASREDLFDKNSTILSFSRRNVSFSFLDQSAFFLLFRFDSPIQIESEKWTPESNPKPDCCVLRALARFIARDELWSANFAGSISPVRVNGSFVVCAHRRSLALAGVRTRECRECEPERSRGALLRKVTIYDYRGHFDSLSFRASFWIYRFVDFFLFPWTPRRLKMIRKAAELLLLQ